MKIEELMAGGIRTMVTTMTEEILIMAVQARDSSAMEHQSVAGMKIMVLTGITMTEAVILKINLAVILALIGQEWEAEMKDIKIITIGDLPMETIIAGIT